MTKRFNVRNLWMWTQSCRHYCNPRFVSIFISVDHERFIRC